jgi:hypothetical protein
MKVKDLIKKLQDLNIPEKEVIFYDDERDWFSEDIKTVDYLKDLDRIVLGHSEVGGL